jgi:hypothetical protein
LLVCSISRLINELILITLIRNLINKIIIIDEVKRENDDWAMDLVVMKIM